MKHLDDLEEAQKKRDEEREEARTEKEGEKMKQCKNCGKGIKEEYELCYECNEALEINPQTLGMVFKATVDVMLKNDLIKINKGIATVDTPPFLTENFSVIFDKLMAIWKMKKEEYHVK